jgi:hypothetical protein
MLQASKVPDKKAMNEFGFGELPTGCIVGKATLVDVKKYKTEEEHKSDVDLHLATNFWGNHGFILENVERMKEISCKGNLNFWEYGER